MMKEMIKSLVSFIRETIQDTIDIVGGLMIYAGIFIIRGWLLFMGLVLIYKAIELNNIYGIPSFIVGMVFMVLFNKSEEVLKPF